MYFVYIIKSIDKNYRYVGITQDTLKRINQHQNGREKTTSPYRPFKVLLIEKYVSRMEARKREKYLKSGVGKEWIKKNFE